VACALQKIIENIKFFRNSDILVQILITRRK